MEGREKIPIIFFLGMYWNKRGTIISEDCLIMVLITSHPKDFSEWWQPRSV